MRRIHDSTAFSKFMFSRFMDDTITLIKYHSKVDGASVGAGV